MKRDILRILEQAPGTAMSVKEIGRRADRERYREDPTWARPFLRALAEEDLVVEDDNHNYAVPRS